MNNDKNTEISITTGSVTLTMRHERVEQLFHDLNRLLGLIDEVVRGDDMNALDRAAYNRTHWVVEQLQRKFDL